MNYLSCAANLDRLVEQFQERYPNLNPIGGTCRNVIKNYMEGIMQWFWDDDEVDDICKDLAESGWFEDSHSTSTALLKLGVSKQVAEDGLRCFQMPLFQSQVK